MAKCKMCEKSGMFFSVSEHGLCKYCEVSFQTMLENNFRRIKDSESIIEKSTNAKTISERFNFLMDLFLELKTYEDNNVPVFSHQIDDIINDIAFAVNVKLLSLIEQKHITFKEKIRITKSEKTKEKIFDKFVSEAGDFKCFFNEVGSNYSDCVAKADSWIEELNR